MNLVVGVGIRGCRLQRGVFDAAAGRVFFGGEIADVALLERYRADQPSADLALLPVNGLRLLFGPRMVMGPRQAVAGSRVLGARVLVPVHDAHGHDPLSRLFRLRRCAAGRPGPARDGPADR